MKLKQYKQGIKKRRYERLRLLRTKQRELGDVTQQYMFPQEYEEFSSPTWSSFSASPLYEEIPSSETEHKRFLQLIIRIACSFMLVAGAYLVMKAEEKELGVMQGFIQEVMHREFNVQGVMAWYEDKVGIEPTFLPQLIKRGSGNQEIAPPEHYILPVSGGQVVASFAQDQQGIMLSTTNPSLPIEVVREGWVVFVGEKQGLGQTVVVEHQGGEESWYGYLEDIQVMPYDWVDQGQAIGYATRKRTDSSHTEGEQGVFYFALKKETQFVNPLDVMKFD